MVGRRPERDGNGQAFRELGHETARETARESGWQVGEEDRRKLEKERI